MNEKNLSRRLSTSVVDALKAHGHILVVKGGAAALARELDELMAAEIAVIAPRLKPLAVLVGEPTSTFGDETVDEAVEEMVNKLTRALMSSDHVEDVFAEDLVIRRDIFRVVRDGLREPVVEPAGEDETVTVKLDTLGYVAATAGRLADAATLRQALDRAASAASARFSGFRPEAREATFRLEGAGPDERLELEEAVADELTDLVEQGVVELPTIERRIDLGRALPAAELRALRARVDAAADATLPRSGCATAWEFEGGRTVRVLFTPLSEQDAHGVDEPTSAFARELAALVSGGRVPPQEARAGHDGAASGPEPRRAARAVAPPPEPSEPAKKKARKVKEAEPSEPAPKRGGHDGAASGPKPQRAAPAGAAKKSSKKEAAPPAKKSAAAPRSSTGKTAAPKSTGKRATSSAAAKSKAPSKKRSS